MQDINLLKMAISELYKNNSLVHVDVCSKKPKINVENASAMITGVYKNIFTVEVVENGLTKSYTVQYTDLFIGRVKIRELDKQKEV